MNQPEPESYPVPEERLLPTPPKPVVKPPTEAALFRQFSVPFLGRDLAMAAVSSFEDDLRAIRVKHKMLDVLCVVNVPTIDPEAPDGETFVVSVMTCGDLAHAAGMVRSAIRILEGK